MIVKNRLKIILLSLFFTISLPTGLAQITMKKSEGDNKPSLKTSRLLGKNLIVNGDAEAQLKGWSKNENFTFSGYGATAGEWDFGVVGAPEGGKNYFRESIPVGQEKISVKQLIDVSSEASLIDSGKIKFVLSGYFGGVVDSDSSTLLSTKFFDKEGQEIGSVSTDPVRLGDLSPPSVGSASMIHRVKTDQVPKATRKIQIELTAQNFNFAECSNCAVVDFADNLEFLLLMKE